MWYFKFRLIFWLWHTLCYMVQKGKDKFYFNYYELQPSSKLIAYLKSPTSYNSERFQQNGEVFCGH